MYQSGEDAKKYKKVKIEDFEKDILKQTTDVLKNYTDELAKNTEALVKQFNHIRCGPVTGISIS